MSDELAGEGEDSLLGEKAEVVMTAYAADPRAYWTARGLTYRAEEAAAVAPVTGRQVAALTAVLRGPRVLEVGCGYGRLLDALDGAFARLVGVDLSLTQLAGACGGDLVACADGVALPFRARAFDSVFTHGAAMHVPPASAGALFAECARVAGARVVHVEEAVPVEGYIWAHDYGAAYRALGWREILCVRAPVIDATQVLALRVYERDYPAHSGLVTMARRLTGPMYWKEA